jgi:hypothetical protein
VQNNNEKRPLPARLLERKEGEHYFFPPILGGVGGGKVLTFFLYHQRPPENLGKKRRGEVVNLYLRSRETGGFVICYFAKAGILSKQKTIGGMIGGS